MILLFGQRMRRLSATKQWFSGRRSNRLTIPPSLAEHVANGAMVWR